MPDIAMCSGNGCELADTCYRHRAVTSDRQFYADFPAQNLMGDCIYYVKIEKEKSK